MSLTKESFTLRAFSCRVVGHNFDVVILIWLQSHNQGPVFGTSAEVVDGIFLPGVLLPVFQLIKMKKLLVLKLSFIA